MVTFGYISLSLAMIFIFPLLIVYSEVSIKVKKGLLWRYITWLLIWFMYISFLTNLSVLVDFELPPKLPLLVFIPVLSSIALFSRNQSLYDFLKETNVQIFPLIQSFRIIVELLIYSTYLQGVLPELVTFNGLNFDILVGISALLIGSLSASKKISNRIIQVWNYIGLAILTLTVFSFLNSFYFAKLLTHDQFEQFLNLPYITLPTILLPFAIFYHVISLKQLALKRN